MERTRLIPGMAGSLDALMGRLQRGYGDPTLRRLSGRWWRTSTTPEGPALVSLVTEGDAVRATGVGDGARWALEQVDGLVGARDHPGDFVTDHPVLWPGLRRGEVRLSATGMLAEALAPNVIEQKVTGAEAFTSFRRLVRRFGTRPPGAESVDHPAHRMACPPDAAGWARIPIWEFLQAGVEERRASTVHRVMMKVPSIERALGADRDGEKLERLVRSVPGIGPWTAAKVRQQVLGDADAWSIDDYHVPGLVVHHLGGENASVVLEEFRPHRYRVELVLLRLGMPERHGARRTLPTHLPVRGGWRG
ncbi:DNA-3-methyladenine glycosylase 2 family protein [Aestuariimicrobium sp. p3-SID1156]|uniref:DNA-3-methyladenine glycosylase family protein n=1 Tax=Aestuariimicrobium sp. p3-SID1156 TaxID=2916038 RepID=UPI00223A7FDD|nr:DNA-3-methyladenine glycosylase 2 family protein [Aestuariimicrobium sp. p3-SID1156]MCT1458140.1 DNA-3-methyladenine glycosylase 2 family protein [Aestuariimicrobium sp. p3-SID1156]